MRSKSLFSYLTLFTAAWMVGGCGILEISPKVTVKGRVVKYRNKNPIKGVSVVAYKQLFNCGAICSTYNRTGDSTGTDSNGNFTLVVSEPGLILGIFKGGYFGLFPGNTGEFRFKDKKTNFGDILLKPYGEVVIELVNTTIGRDTISYRIYACGEDIDRGLFEDKYIFSRRHTIKRSVEAECEVFIYFTLIRNGKTSITKETFYLDIDEIKNKTIQL